MKPSNKILIGFFGFLFIYLTAAFAEVRLRGTLNILDDSSSIKESVDISNIEYLILSSLDYNVDVVGSNRPRIEVRSASGDVLGKLKYHISGDSLTLSGLKTEDIKTLNISVFVPKSALKGLTVDSAVAMVKGLDQEALNIYQNAGRIKMSDNKINNMHLQASNSYLEISALNLDTLSANVEDSQVIIVSPVRLLKGSIKNNSFLRGNDVDEIQLRKDETSKLNLHQ